jgi:transposase-like protein
MMTLEEIHKRRDKLKAQLAELNKQIAHIRVEFQHLYLECPHTNSYNTNCCGRDPGGWYCPDCGQSR